MWVHIRCRMSLYGPGLHNNPLGGMAYLWWRTFIINAPIWACCTRGLHRSCLVRTSRAAATSAGKTEGKNLTNNPAESSRIWKRKYLLTSLNLRNRIQMRLGQLYFIRGIFQTADEDQQFFSGEEVPLSSWRGAGQERSYVHWRKQIKEWGWKHSEYTNKPK